MLSFSVLASGSSGNAIYIQTSSTKILLDAGISGKQLQTRLGETCGVSLTDMDAVLVTHEHVDHVRGLKQVLKLSRASVHATDGTWAALANGVDTAMLTQRYQQVRAGVRFTVGDVTITPFAVSHDANEPVAYRFDAADQSVAVVTDLGYMSDAIKGVLAGCQAFVLETNHDIEMLRAGRYPWSLKRRILGDKGHLSNEDAAIGLIDVLDETSHGVDVYTAHLSEENNQPDLADVTVQSLLREAGSRYAEQVTLHRTSRHYATPMHHLGSD